MPKALSIRLPDELASRIEADAERLGNSINTQVVAMLENAKATNSDMRLSVRVQRDVLVAALKYHADDELGLDPVLESDADVEHWTKYVLREVGGVDSEIGVSATTSSVVVTGGIEVAEAIRSYIN